MTEPNGGWHCPSCGRDWTGSFKPEREPNNPICPNCGDGRMDKWEHNPTRDDPVQVNLSEADLAFIEHALAVTILWNKQDGDGLLGERYNDIREELLDAHIDWLEERGGYD